MNAAMVRWIKENLVLASGVVLPVLLVAGFFVLSKSPIIVADPPQYDFVLVAYRNDYQHPRDYALFFEVRDGKLHGRLVPGGASGAHPNRQYAGIFRYRAADNAFEEIIYELPPGREELRQVLSFPVAEAGNLELDQRGQSPDGYRFEFLGYRGRGGLLGELFGMGRRHDSDYVLSKGGAYFNLPRPAPDRYYYQHDMHFMGWVIDAGDAN